MFMYLKYQRWRDLDKLYCYRERNEIENKQLSTSYNTMCEQKQGSWIRFCQKMST